MCVCLCVSVCVWKGRSLCEVELESCECVCVCVWEGWVTGEEYGREASGELDGCLPLETTHRAAYLILCTALSVCYHSI